MTWQISQKSLNDVSSSTGKEPEREPCHHTDPIEFETLLKISEDLVRSVDSYNTITATSTPGMAIRSVNLNRISIPRPMESAASSVQIVQLLEDLNESMAKNTDILVNMAKENSQYHVETMKSFENMTDLLSSSPHKGEGIKTIPSSQPSWRKCYYCWDNRHFIVDCESLNMDIAEGKIDAHARVESDQFPKEPVNLSPKDRVHEQWKDRTQFFIEGIPDDGFADITPSGLVALQSGWNQDQKQFLIEDPPEDGIITLQCDWKRDGPVEDPSLPEEGIIDLTPDGIVTLQFNLNRQDEKDDLISELEGKARRAAEECDMWKAVQTKTEQMNMSVPIDPQIPRSIPQPAVLPMPMADLKTAEFMTMLAEMMSLSTQENIENDLQIKSQ